ncbi:MAG: bleomycin resistance protein [Anaerolineales bacterium]
MRLNSAIPILPAARLDESVAFYQRLGFTVGYDDGDYAIVQRDGAELQLFVQRDLNPLENDAGCYFRVTDIDALFAQVRESGAKIISPLEAKPWGQREFAAVDPSHNLLRFGEAAQ